MFGTTGCVILLWIRIIVVEANNVSATPPPDPLSASVSRASSWLLSERVDESGWGPLTPRVAVALEMGEEAAPLNPADHELITKHLNVLLSLELGKDQSTSSLSLSRLALFVNALIATCQNPHSFHGLDLVNTLRRRADTDSGHSALFPIAYLTLCVAGEATPEDFSAVGIMFRNHTKMDLQAIDLMALSCIARQWAYPGYKSFAESSLQDFIARFHQIEETADVYTMALAYQAIQSFGGTVNISSLLSRQLPSGSFGSLLATYQAIPALLGKSLGQIRCNRKGNPAPRLSAPPLSPPGGVRVLYTLQVGDKNDQDRHTVTVTVPPNSTFLEVMRVAEEKNPAFRFQTQETSKGLRVYILAGIPNDMELERYWTLYKFNDELPHSGKKHHRTLVKHGLEKVFPANEDHFIFQFKRRTCSITDNGVSQCDF